jgi:stage IV sporulation protein FB
MFFVEPDRTPFDLNFRVFRVPVRVHPLFWLVMGLLGLTALGRGGVGVWLIWMAIAFVSLLVHELGHALVARTYGASPHVVLYAFGGLAGWFGAGLTRGQRIAVALAGPFAGFALMALAMALGGGPGAASSSLWAGAMVDLYLINLVWNLLNLLPVWPLDGGAVTRELFNIYRPRDGERLAFGSSALVAGGLVVFFLLMLFDMLRPLLMMAWPFRFTPGPWFTLILALLAFQNYQLYRRETGRAGWDDELPWERRRRG